MAKQDYYQILGVAKSASDKDHNSNQTENKKDHP